METRDKPVIIPKGTMVETIKQVNVNISTFSGCGIINYIKRGANLKLAEDVLLGDKFAKCVLLKLKPEHEGKRINVVITMPIRCRNIRVLEY